MAVLIGGVPRVQAAPAAAPAAPAAPAPPAVAALYFDYDGADSDLGQLRKGFTSMLISDLADLDAIRLVERDRLESVLAELKLQASPKFDPTTAVKVGKLLGARFLVMGRFFASMNKFRVDARIIDMQTGHILASFGETGISDDFLALEQKLAGALKAHFTKIVPPLDKARTETQTATPPRPQSAKPPSPLKAKTVAEYGRALEAADRGDKQAAKKILEKVVAEAPDFSLAAADLDRLMK
ncbi:MAG TPA: CsgG/HfaB family protein [Kofleriaceae bacterium]|nr:CsgG/HfaB family protein [Kofleriaceae bacterium]